MAGDVLSRTDGSSEATASSGRTEAILGRLERAGLNRDLVVAAFAPLVGAVATLWLVIPTLAPGLFPGAAGGDTAEFQTVAPVLGTAHPTGYPAYVILGFIASHVLPFADAAYRMNLLQALLAAGAIAGTIAVVQFLTGMRWIALATGLLLLIMPGFSPVGISFPASGFTTTPVFWRLSTYADPHMFHLALVTLLFLLLLVWERRRTEEDPQKRRRADRLLVAAALVYGVAFANHSLTVMLAPAVGLFVLAVAPFIIRQWRLVLACAAVLVATVVILFLELPIRAAMHAPVVYAHPDTWSGFLYVVLGQQFGGIPSTIGDDLGAKYALVMNMISSWLGPLGYVAALGLGTSLVRRPRYVLLGLVAAAMTCAFSAAYANSDLERYFLVPVFVAFTFVGLGLADALSLGMWLVGSAAERFAAPTSPPALSATAPPDAATVTPAAATAPPDAPGRGNADWSTRTLLLVEIVAAVALVAASAALVPARQHAQDADHLGGVSQTNQNADETWMRAMLAPPDQGGLPADAVIVSWWGSSNALWYGQKVEGLRPDVYVVDDRTRLDQNLGQVWDVIDSYLGTRPVFLERLYGGPDGMQVLSVMYELKDFTLTDGETVSQVISKKGTP